MYKSEHEIRVRQLSFNVKEMTHTDGTEWANKCNIESDAKKFT